MASDDDDHATTDYLQQDPDEQDVEDDVSDQNLDDEQEDVDLIDDDEEDDVDDDEEQDEDDSTSSAAGDVTIAVAGGLTGATPTVSTPVAVTPTTATTTTPSVVRSDASVDLKKPLDDSRRLFQRLWTDEDEIELLQGFLEYTTQRGTNSSHHHDTTAFYDQIKGKLQLDFNKNQLVEKLRRLKKKYRNVIAKISAGKDYVFKSPHDQAAFDLSCKIWSEPVSVSAPVLADGGGIDDEEAQNPNISFNLNENNVNGNGAGAGVGVGDPSSSEKKAARPRKRSRSTAVKMEDGYNQPQQYGQAMGAGAANSNANALTPNLVEETVKSCLLPLFKELVNNSPNGASGNSMGSGLGLGSGLMNFAIGDMNDEKWRKQHIMELEVYSKRLELMQDQISSRLEELRSMGNS